MPAHKHQRWGQQACGSAVEPSCGMRRQEESPTSNSLPLRPPPARQPGPGPSVKRQSTAHSTHTHRNSCALTHESCPGLEKSSRIFWKSHVLPSLFKLDWRTGWLKKGVNYWDAFGRHHLSYRFKSRDQNAIWLKFPYIFYKPHPLLYEIRPASQVSG